MPDPNFMSNLFTGLPPTARGLVALGADGSRREWTFGELDQLSSRYAGALQSHGVGRGDVVLTLVGSRPEWVLTLAACWRMGAVAFPCNEQLRPHDLEKRLAVTRPAVVVCDERNRATLEAAGYAGEILQIPDFDFTRFEPIEDPVLDPEEPALLVFTSGTSGEPKLVRHGQRYLPGQAVQAEHWFGAQEGDLCWCTASTGWSKSSRNSFLVAWLRGAAALLHDGRFDPEERLDIVDRESVNVLCMSPTEFRAIAKRTEMRPLPSLRHALAAGEPLNAEIVQLWRDVAGVEIYDGYGQTETGHLTGMPHGEPVRPGAMGKPLPGFRMWIEEGELCVDPATVPTITLDAPAGTWRTGDRVRQDEDGYLWFEGRADDVIISAGYRIGPFEVESALVSHPAVAEAAAVSAPDEIRGAVVRAIVVLTDGNAPSDDLVSELQEHVRQETAPYKYPRIVEFAEALPKTASGKIKRAELRAG